VNPKPTIEEMQKYYRRVITGTMHKSLMLSGGDCSLRKQFFYPHEACNGHRSMECGCARVLSAFHGGTGMDGRAWNFGIVGRIKDFRVHTRIPDIPVNEPTYDALTAWLRCSSIVHDPMAAIQKKPPGWSRRAVCSCFVRISEHRARNSFPARLLGTCISYAGNVRQYLETPGNSRSKKKIMAVAYQVAPYNWVAFHGADEAAEKYR